MPIISLIFTNTLSYLSYYNLTYNHQPPNTLFFHFAKSFMLIYNNAESASLLILHDHIL